MTDLFDQDAAGDVTWLDGNGPLEAQGDCDHNCWHKPGQILAAGTGQRTDKLVGCSKCGCRVWMTKSGIPATRWQKVADDTIRVRRKWKL